MTYPLPPPLRGVEPPPDRVVVPPLERTLLLPLVVVPEFLVLVLGRVVFDAGVLLGLFDPLIFWFLFVGAVLVDVLFLERWVVVFLTFCEFLLLLILRSTSDLE